MSDFLPYVVGIMLLIVVLGFFNERKTKITYEIALMLFSAVIGAVLLVAYRMTGNHDTTALLDRITSFDLEDYLMKGVLCYMLFSGSCHMKPVLYVILGLSLIRILGTPYVILVSVCAIVCNLIGRAASVWMCTFFMGPIPSGYERKSFVSLMTWGGLRGALCIALAMSTKPMLANETYRVILGGTYAIVAFTTIIQGLTMPGVYNRIKASVK